MTEIQSPMREEMSVDSRFDEQEISVETYYLRLPYSRKMVCTDTGAATVDCWHLLKLNCYFWTAIVVTFV